MDRNSAIGLTLIAALLLAYFYFFSPEPQPQNAKPATETQSTVSPQINTPAPSPQLDSTLTSALGAQAITGQESITTVETEDLKIMFSSKGGVFHEVELKRFKTYSQQPLRLITPGVSQFHLLSRYQGKDIDLYSLFYTATQQQVGDTTIVSFSVPVGASGKITQEYRIPRKGYALGYSIKTTGLDQQLTGDNVAFQWNDFLTLKEKDLTETRNNTTITYYGSEEGFDELSPRGEGTEKETFAPNQIKWVAIKEKFFLSSFISENGFAGGTVETTVNAADSSLVKRANVELLIPTKSLADGKAKFKFYIGPNDYQIIGDVTEKFSKNVYLGWPPVFWINKFVIFPVFHFLTGFISNYGLIIVILVILLKLVLAPLSYRSYLSMAKMKVLKPELDEIKERVGEDMTKVQQEQMKLYQQVGVNPISGCIPVLLQMPILFAMFYLFPASIELRQEHFLWAEDLSTYDSLIKLPFALPLGIGSHISLFTLLMTASTLIYTWQNNQMSSVQGPMKSMSYIMPLIFFFVLNSFSAGLTFYYFVSNLVTFAQQAIIRKFVDDDKIKALLDENRKKIAASGGTKSKFMSKLTDAMKASEEARKKAEDERKKKKK